MLFASYRKADFDDPDAFINVLGSALEDYSVEVIEYVTNPKTGIQRRSKFPPTVSEIVAECEQHAAFLGRVEKMREWGTPAQAAGLIEPPPRSDRPSYDELMAKFGDNWGLDDFKRRDPTKPKWQKFTDEELLEHYGRFDLAYVPKNERLR